MRPSSLIFSILEEYDAVMYLGSNYKQFTASKYYYQPTSTDISSPLTFHRNTGNTQLLSECGYTNFKFWVWIYKLEVTACCCMAIHLLLLNISFLSISRLWTPMPCFYAILNLLFNSGFRVGVIFWFLSREH